MGLTSQTTTRKVGSLEIVTDEFYKLFQALEWLFMEK